MDQGLVTSIVDLFLVVLSVGGSAIVIAWTWIEVGELVDHRRRREARNRVSSRVAIWPDQAGSSH